MDVTHIIDGLNDAQRDAVIAPLNSTLVLADEKLTDCFVC